MIFSSKIKHWKVSGHFDEGQFGEKTIWRDKFDKK